MIKNGNKKERFLIFLIVNLFLFFVIFASINNWLISKEGITPTSTYRSVEEMQINNNFLTLENEQVPLSDTPLPTEPNLQQMALNVLDSINIQRTASGLKPLKWDNKLENCAKKRAIESATSFSHTRPNGKPWYTVNSKIMGGENLAYGYSTAKDVMAAWMNSPTHKENILWPEFTKIGISIYLGPDGVYYWAQEFGY